MKNSHTPTHQRQGHGSEKKEQSSMRQQAVPFQDGQLTLVVDEQDVCWMSLPSACTVLGLNTRGQLQRIQRTPDLVVGLRQFLLSTHGGQQHTNCLRVDLLSPWLESLKNVQPEQHIHFLQISIDAATSLRDSVKCEPYHPLLPFDEEQITEDQEQHVSTPTLLPGLAQILVVSSHAEDRAIREATFASQDDWQEEPRLGLPYYLASNHMRVYIGDPEFPLEQEEAQAALGHLRESTILTARYVLGRWNIAREQGQLAQEGSVPIRTEEVLEWRGLQKHSRALYPGSPIRRIEGYEIKYRNQVHDDLKILSQMYLRGMHHVRVEGQWRSVNIDGFYLRAGRLQNPENDQELYYVAPGVWINTYELSGLWLAELDRRIFMLHPQRDQIALRIALFLSEHWQLQLMMGKHEAVPLSMQELLERSMVAIDQNHLMRFIPRVEAALQRLLTNGIVEDAKPLQEIPRDHAQWGKEWLTVRWCLTPPAEMLYRHAQHAPGILLSSPRVSAIVASQDLQKREGLLHLPSEGPGKRAVGRGMEGEEKRPAKSAEADLTVVESIHAPFEESR